LVQVASVGRSRGKKWSDVKSDLVVEPTYLKNMRKSKLQKIFPPTLGVKNEEIIETTTYLWTPKP